MRFSRVELARMIDSTVVKATATRADVERLCREAVEYGFGCVCVNPVYVSLASRLLAGTPVKVCSTVGFPLGVSIPAVKGFEAKKAVEDGATELDMVMNLSAFKSGDYSLVKKDIEAVLEVKNLYSKRIVVKVIIETAFLNSEEIVSACKLCKEAGADFVKTSTGLFGKGATVEDVRLMRKTVGEDVGVKAAGGIRTYADALKMIEAGANRIGTSTAAAIIEGCS
ncbi:deoxyribose-phosphate aldolase [Candidatus Bathyarchaeota archaeon]|nr:MAG: deoxyribose-phosphate aldolase [Candidatus Bathyarchaeota archaeon]RLI29909.1 MAG: deoxyribose-phosphate aldolase [Candidatus Bathyarchaeota archaeon]